ncbi:hypothetical protein BYT27DRAFT_7118441, partial [Phlegmacium glaucopus]
MIGDIPEQDKVIKFWNSSRPVIQKGLWRDNLNPEISTWERVISQAEIIEIAENVAERRDRKSLMNSQPSGITSSNSGANYKSKNQPTRSSVRSVFFGMKQLRRPRSRTGGQHSARPVNLQPDTYRRSQTPGQRSVKEKAELISAGKCFECKETGHLARNCPTKTTVKSNGSRPPGASTFNIEPAPLPESDWDERVEVLDSLPVGAIFLEEDSSVPLQTIPKGRDNYLYWDEPGVAARSMIGDCYAMLAESILTLEQPFPGD